MFLAATDTCDFCKETIYPDDEKVSGDMCVYHLECAQDNDLLDDE